MVMWSVGTAILADDTCRICSALILHGLVFGSMSHHAISSSSFS